MRILNILALLASFIFALSSNELYQKALEFENAGNITQAMKFYKMAYENTADIKPKNSVAKNEILNLQISQNKSKNVKNLASVNADNAINAENFSQNKSALNDDADAEVFSGVAAAKQDGEVGYLDIALAEPNYLLPATYAAKVHDGRSKFETKFHISLKKPLFYDLLGFNESIGVAYSQTSWWQTSRHSTPFRESSYRPEIYASVPFDGFGAFKGIRVGLLHESNGQGSKRSRSWNRVYASTDFIFKKLSVTPRAWASVGDLSDNEDIRKNIGIADVKIKYTIGGHHLNLLLRNNLRLDDTNRGAAELGWFFPLFSSGLYGYLQYFNGYGENLMDYDRHMNKIGLGFAILK